MLHLLAKTVTKRTKLFPYCLRSEISSSREIIQKTLPSLCTLCGSFEILFVVPLICCTKVFFPGNPLSKQKPIGYSTFLKNAVAMPFACLLCPSLEPAHPLPPFRESPPSYKSSPCVLHFSPIQPFSSPSSLTSYIQYPLLQMHRRQTQNLAPLRALQLLSHQTAQTTANRLATLVDQHASVVVELHYAAVGARVFLCCADHYGVADVAAAHFVGGAD